MTATEWIWDEDENAARPVPTTAEEFQAFRDGITSAIVAAFKPELDALRERVWNLEHPASPPVHGKEG